MRCSAFAAGSGTEPSRLAPQVQGKQRGARLCVRGSRLVALLTLCVGGSLSSAEGTSPGPPPGGAEPAAPLAEPNPAFVEALVGALPAAAALAQRRRHAGRVNPDHDDAYEYRLPYADGVSHRVLQAYGSALSHRGDEHYTVDFAMPEGTVVHAARDGEVALSESRHRIGCAHERCADFANYVLIEHADGTIGGYFHLAPGGVLVQEGEYVERGDPIALSGNTGFSSTPHLHFGVYRRSGEGRALSLPVRIRARNGMIDAPRAGARYENLPLAQPVLAPNRPETAILRDHE